MSIVLIPALLILFYFVFLRPQQQRLRKQRDLTSSLEVGDEIVTAGGMIGQIMELGDERAVIEVADGVEIEFLRAAISRKVEPSSRAYYDPDESESGEDTVDEVEGHEDAAANNHGGPPLDAPAPDTATHDTTATDAPAPDTVTHDTTATHDPTVEPTGQSAANQKNHPASEGSDTPEQDKQ
jgi:preprotein translocase subunit YajC